MSTFRTNITSRVPCIESRVFRVSGFGFRVSGFGFVEDVRRYGCEFRVDGFWVKD